MTWGSPLFSPRDAFDNAGTVADCVNRLLETLAAHTELVRPVFDLVILPHGDHVRNAIARFNQVKSVSDDDRDAAWKRIKAAAKKFDVEVSEKSWREIAKS